MKTADLELYKQKLLALRARLRGDVNAMENAALRKGGDGEGHSMPIHMAELGSDNFEQEFTLSLMETEGEALTEIENALVRIEEGAYGKCDDCSGVIPKTRLNALPFAPLCVKCASARESG
ncbi:General stress protein 16O [Posidoniimonas polymericola]|uniref:General stress protein 16O n=1 Tax=Posidoniimonas polymericola TaxID=2528002 RepID=A0A5C5XVA0_9BACT|nr:TraR/DksA C4-type zinc finger protein [Posidoniimonas polymericola]TWT66810.1 General stress protein 16O [Posidoniimonas polymericola]